jgi:hypothetical protein
MSSATIEEGRLAVGLARKILETALDEPYGPDLLSSKDDPSLTRLFKEKRGVFVTLLTHPGKDLRGCIGFTGPVYPLAEAIAKAAWLAAREDYRFPPVATTEVKHLVVEVSILGLMEPIAYKTPEDLLRQVVVGRDGLVVAGNGGNGLLLPQVPVDEGWSAEDFLRGVCMKAGLPSTAWKRPGLSFWRFSSQVFSEETPNGEVTERPLAPSTTAKDSKAKP